MFKCPKKKVIVSLTCVLSLLVTIEASSAEYLLMEPTIDSGGLSVSYYYSDPIRFTRISHNFPEGGDNNIENANASVPPTISSQGEQISIDWTVVPGIVGSNADTEYWKSSFGYSYTGHYPSLHYQTLANINVTSSFDTVSVTCNSGALGSQSYDCLSPATSCSLGDICFSKIGAGAFKMQISNTQNPDQPRTRLTAQGTTIYALKQYIDEHTPSTVGSHSGNTEILFFELVSGMPEYPGKGVNYGWKLPFRKVVTQHSLDITTDNLLIDVGDLSLVNNGSTDWYTVPFTVTLDGVRPVDTGSIGEGLASVTRTDVTLPQNVSACGLTAQHQINGIERFVNSSDSVDLTEFLSGDYQVRFVVEGDPASCKVGRDTWAMQYLVAWN